MLAVRNNFIVADGYLSNIHFIDGQALDATSFGQFTNGYWEKKDYAGTYGTNGFHLTFADDVVSEGFQYCYLSWHRRLHKASAGWALSLI